MSVRLHIQRQQTHTETVSTYRPEMISPKQRHLCPRRHMGCFSRKALKLTLTVLFGNYAVLSLTKDSDLSLRLKNGNGFSFN